VYIYGMHESYLDCKRYLKTQHQCHVISIWRFSDHSQLKVGQNAGQFIEEHNYLFASNCLDQHFKLDVTKL